MKPKERVIEKRTVSRRQGKVPQKQEEERKGKKKKREEEEEEEGLP